MAEREEYVSTMEWGASQDPPIGRQRAYELVIEGRIEGAQLIAGVYMVPKNAKRLPPTDKSRARQRERYRRYHSSASKSGGHDGV